MEVKRYIIDYDFDTGAITGVCCPNGEYVKYKDYEYLSDYCDRLVEVGKLPCLPKDLENLRKANASFAQENHDLKLIIQEHRDDIEGWQNKWKCAVEMAAKAENERDALKKELHRAIELRDVWHGKWKTARNECIVKVDLVKELLDDIANKA
jgi:regulator of replication initiation timing